MNLFPNPGENEEQYIWRLGQAKENGLIDITWTDIADLVNKYFHDEDEYFNESAYRKPYSQAKRFLDAGVFNDVDDKEKQDLVNLRHEIIKEKQLLFDERRDLKKMLRDEARQERLLSTFTSELKELGEKKYSYTPPLTDVAYGGDRDMIVIISDPHFGANFNHFTGQYNPEIADARMKAYLEKAIKVGHANNVDKCYVVCLGDLISGNIHKTVSVTNSENVVEQVKTACESITHFVYWLSTEFNSVEVHGVSGNHSRLEAKDIASIDERLDMIIPWYVKNMLAHIPNVVVSENYVDNTACTFRVYNKTYVGVHGDFDGMNESAVNRLVTWLGEIPYCVLMGHKHYNAMTEINNIKVVQAGSLCGTGDEYTRQRRLIGKPAQMILICNKGEIEMYCPVEF